MEKSNQPLKSKRMERTIKVFIVFMAAILMSCNSDGEFISETLEIEGITYIRNTSTDKKVEVTLKLTRNGDTYTRVYQVNPGEEKTTSNSHDKAEIVGEVIINE